MKDSDRAEAYGWWWRTPKTLGPKKLWTYYEKKGRTLKGDHYASTWFWRRGRETAAHDYELVRRLKPDLQLPPWPKLDMYESQCLIKAIGKAHVEEPWKISSDHCDTSPVDPDFTWPIRFNLRATDSTIIKSFGAIIKTFLVGQRDIKKRQPEKHRRNPVSWRWVEIWDIDLHEQIVFSNSWSAQLSKAKKRAREVAPKVQSALTDAKKLKADLGFRVPKRQRVKRND